MQRHATVSARLLYVGVFAMAAAATIAFVIRGSIGEKEVAAAFLAMVGTFVGALFAFRLNESRENAKLDKERKASLNRALFVVARQYNALRSLDRDLASFTSQFDRAFNFPAIRLPPYSDLVIDFESLDFLLELSDPNLLMRLSVEQEGFHQAMESLRTRNEVYVNQIQPLIEKHSLNGRSVTVEEFHQAFGERLFGSAVSGSNILYSNVEKSIERLPSVHAELFAAAKAIYPNAKLIKLVAEA